jgi:hypothetical protein
MACSSAPSSASPPGAAAIAETVEAALVGVFDITKVGSQAWTVGAKVYWDDTNKRCTTVATDNTADRRGRRGGGERRGRHHRPGAPERERSDERLRRRSWCALRRSQCRPRRGLHRRRRRARAGARRLPGGGCVTDFGDARLWSETTRIDLRVAEVANPRPGDRIEIDGDAFLIQGEPIRDRERLVWTVDLRPA